MSPTSQQSSIKVQHTPDSYHRRNGGTSAYCSDLTWGWMPMSTSPPLGEWYEDGNANRVLSSLESHNHTQRKPQLQINVRQPKSSSLKTNKTPPGTPGGKKIVRFADCLGLDLVDVKLFLDEIPNVPKSAFE